MDKFIEAEKKRVKEGFRSISDRIYWLNTYKPKGWPFKLWETYHNLIALCMDSHSRLIGQAMARKAKKDYPCGVVGLVPKKLRTEALSTGEVFLSKKHPSSFYQKYVDGDWGEPSPKLSINFEIMDTPEIKKRCLEQSKKFEENFTKACNSKTNELYL